MKEREYLKELGKKITDSSVRKEIVNEYEAHIEDCKAALMESGMTEVEAEEEAVRQMGDPQEAGEAMDKIYHKVFDSNMFLWMLALGCVPIVCVCISYLIARDPNAFLWLWNDALGLNKIPAVIHRNIGIGLAVYGIGLSFWEKYTGKALFYAVGRDWGQGCYVANSGLVLFISALCFAPSFPVKGYAGILCCVFIDRMSAEYGTERIYESFAEQKRDQTFMGDWNGRYQNQLEGKRISVWTSYESKSTGI